VNAPWPRRRWGRAGLLFLAGVLLWTLLVCYPNPAVFFRNLSRYHRLPLDPAVEREMGWSLPADPAKIERFVDDVLVPAADWDQYRVPWYVPTPREVATSLKGDCESKTLLFASLLAGRHLPFEIRASFNHIWVDYPGRPPHPGERAQLAYLQGAGGRLAFRWPAATDWRTCYRVQKQMLWEDMPPFRKLTWLAGLLWVLLAATALVAPLPRAEYPSRWRPSLRLYLRPLLAVLFAQVLASAFLLGLGDWPLRRAWVSVFPEVTAAALALAWLVAWLLLRFLPRRLAGLDLEDAALLVSRARAGLRARCLLPLPDVRHLELLAPRSREAPWTISAVLRTGRREPLLHYRREVEARAVLAQLGRRLALPLLVLAERTETPIPAEEIGLPLSARRGLPAAPPPPRPDDLDLLEETLEDRWTLSYPRTSRALRWVLLLLVLLPTAVFALLSSALRQYLHWPLAWVCWGLAAALLCATIYLLIVVREEMVARLSSARLEIAEGEVRFYRPDGKLERLPVASVETVELGRADGSPSVAVVTPQHVLHVRDLFTLDERPWVRATLTAAIVSAQQRQLAPATQA